MPASDSLSIPVGPMDNATTTPPLAFHTLSHPTSLSTLNPLPSSSSESTATSVINIPHITPTTPAAAASSTLDLDAHLHPDFTEGDTLLLSSDGVSYRLPSFFLRRRTAYFREFLPAPDLRSDSGSQIRNRNGSGRERRAVVINVSAEVLTLVLLLLTGRSPFSSSSPSSSSSSTFLFPSIPTLEKATHLLLQWDAPGPLDVIRQSILSYITHYDVDTGKGIGIGMGANDESNSMAVAAYVALYQQQQQIANANVMVHGTGGSSSPPGSPPPSNIINAGNPTSATMTSSSISAVVTDSSSPPPPPEPPLPRPAALLRLFALSHTLSHSRSDGSSWKRETSHLLRATMEYDIWQPTGTMMTIDWQKSLEGIDAGSLLTLMRERRRRVGVVRRVLDSGRSTSSVPAPAPRKTKKPWLGNEEAKKENDKTPAMFAEPSLPRQQQDSNAEELTFTFGLPFHPNSPPPTSNPSSSLAYSPNCPASCDSCHTPIALPTLQTLHSHWIALKSRILSSLDHYPLGDRVLEGIGVGVCTGAGGGGGIEERWGDLFGVRCEGKAISGGRRQSDGGGNMNGMVNEGGLEEEEEGEIREGEEEEDECGQPLVDRKKMLIDLRRVFAGLDADLLCSDV